MDGLLAQHGVIDRSAVHDALNTDVISGGDIVYRLLDLELKAGRGHGKIDGPFSHLSSSALGASFIAIQRAY